jgi:TolB protein
MKKFLLLFGLVLVLGCKKSDSVNNVDTSLSGDLLFIRQVSSGAFASAEIFKLNTATGTLVTNFSVNGTITQRSIYGMGWNSTKTKIVFSSTKDNLDGDIYTCNADGTSVTRLTTNGFMDILPEFSPDGTKIAFITGSDLVIMNADGTNQSMLTTSAANGRIQAFCFKNNSEIYFTSDKDFARNDIYKVNITSLAKTRITTNLGIIGDFELSSDGNYFVYAKDLTSNFRVDEIYKIKVDGTSETRLTNFSNNGALNIDTKSPCFTTDGRIIFESTKDETTYGELYVMQSDGSNVRRLTNNTKAEHLPKIR